MRSKSLQVALVAAIVILAGCAAGVSPDDSGSTGLTDAEAGTAAPAGATEAAGGSSATSGSAESNEGTDTRNGDATGSGTAGGESTSGSVAIARSTDYGTVDFYLSDRPSAIDKFDSLTVTVTQVAFHKAGSGEDEDRETNGTDETSGGNDTDTTTTETEPVTSTPTSNQSSGLTTPTPSETEENLNGMETDNGTETEPEESASSDAGWITYQVDNRQADLTQLRGPNATLVGNYDLPSGKYTMVRIAVESPTGVLNDGGETVTVKVPSNRLRLNRPFTVGVNETLSFVFDITVVEAGGSGKFVLTPVVGQSGPSVPFNANGGKPSTAGPPTKNGSGPGTSGGAGGPPSAAENATLEATVLGNLKANETATLRVTADNQPVSGAAVSVDGTVVGQTDDRGRVSFTVPATDSITLVVTADDRTTELEVRVSDGGGQSDTDDGGGPPANGGNGNGNGPQK